MTFKRLFILTLLTGSCAAQEITVPQANSFLPEQAAEATREEQTYAEATNLLNSNQWERAAERFNDVASLKGRRADAGLYWKAYALNKMSRRADALTTISELRRQYPHPVAAMVVWSPLVVALVLFAADLAQWRQRMSTAAGKAAYRERGKAELTNAEGRRQGLYQVTVRGLRIVRVDTEKNLLLIEGAVPGSDGGLLTIQRLKQR